MSSSPRAASDVKIELPKESIWEFTAVFIKVRKEN